MLQISNGHSGDNAFLSDNLASLLEWCLNYRKNVHFYIDASHTFYKVKIEYGAGSEGRYKKGAFDCYLYMTIENIKGVRFYDTIYINNDDDCSVERAVRNFNVTYMLDDFKIKNLFGDGQ